MPTQRPLETPGRPGSENEPAARAWKGLRRPGDRSRGSKDPRASRESRSTKRMSTTFAHVRAVRPSRPEDYLTMSEVQTVEVALTRKEGYRFEVDWALPNAPPGTLDEAPPIGGGAGPNPSRLVASAVAHCLSSSLLFCLAKSRVEVGELRTVARAEIQRNERGRWRLSRLTVELDPSVAPEQAAQLERCKGLFEDFCIVTESIRRGIPVDVRWKAAAVPSSSA